MSSLPVVMTGQSGRQAGLIRNGEMTEDREYREAVAALDTAFQARWWPVVRSVFQQVLAEDLVTRLAFDSVPGQCLVELSSRTGSESRVAELLAPLLGDQGYYKWGPLTSPLITLLPCHMSKAEAVRHIQRRTGVTPAETIVAGDGCNDLPMFDTKLAGWCVAPANAEPVVQQRLEEIGGIIANAKYSWGVIEAVRSILARS